MSELRFEPYTMPGAALGPENPLPPLTSMVNLSSAYRVNESYPLEDQKFTYYGGDFRTLPHRLQDDYDRHPVPRPFAAAVLENRWLKATFLPGLGGRLWSLIHKPTGRELLDRNPVFQPANLATRNAWFCGGVEWNVGVMGHTPYTCSPLFAARLKTADGCPVLRLYEWDRSRGVPYQIDAWLPDQSQVLFVRPRIINPHDRTIPMYWWTNIAVLEEPGGRVLAPTHVADHHHYVEGMVRLRLPEWRDSDMTYPDRRPHAGDLYYLLREKRRNWMAAVDKDGKGLVHATTKRLRGRKLWYWGCGPGGQRWQEFLAVPGHKYIEIQAGLSATQAECLPMPAGADWSWLEAYGLLDGDADKLHSTDWSKAIDHVDECLGQLVTERKLEQLLKDTEGLANTPPEKIEHAGSGWGALENERRRHAGATAMNPPSTPFPEDSLGSDQKPWQELLENGRLPQRGVGEAPGAFMVQEEWRELLEQSVQRREGEHWLSWLHLGIMHYYWGDAGGAEKAWNKSLELEKSGWALRNLGAKAAHEYRWDDASDLLLAAVRLLPNVAGLTVECMDALIRAARYDEALKLFAGAPETVRQRGRAGYHRARGQLMTGQYDTVEAYIRGLPVIPDMREGETSISGLWFSLFEHKLAAQGDGLIDEPLTQRIRREFPPPPELDFRMSTVGSGGNGSAKRGASAVAKTTAGATKPAGPKRPAKAGKAPAKVGAGKSRR